MGAQTNSGRLSLSSSVFANRIKKFDTYEHTNRTQRTSQRETTESTQHSHKAVMQPTQSKPFKGLGTIKSPSQIPRSINQNTPKKLDANKVVSASNPIRSAKEASSSNIQSVQRLAMQAVIKTPASNKSVIADQFQDMSVAGTRGVKQKKSKLQTAMYSMAVAVFLFASAVSVQTLLTNQQTQEVLAEKTQSTDGQGVAEGTGSEPAEEPVPDDAIIDYQVAAELPRYLKIPDIDVFARIKHTGVEPGGAVDAPSNIHDVSWFNESAKPGNAIGASLLLGHVQGWSGPGVFKNIDKLKAGDRFTVEKGSGETLTYEVTKGKEFTLDKVNMGQILSAEDPGEHDMKLMTCSGAYDAATESYLSRYVVYAKIIR